MTMLYNQTHLRTYRKTLRKQLTKSEAVLWKHIKASQLGYKFRRQHSVGNYILDFYCPEVRLAIELDGYTHLDYEQSERDMKKTTYLQEKRITMLRFSDSQIIDTLPEAIEHIRNTCKALRC